MNGSTLFQITASYQGTLQRAFTGSSDSGTQLFRADKKWSCTASLFSWLTSGGAKLEVTFANAQNGDPVTLIVKGYGLMTTAEVTLNGEVIALFTREFWGKGLFNNSKAVRLRGQGRADSSTTSTLRLASTSR